MHIRTETKEELAEVFRLHYEAFGKRENESRLAERIRHSSGFIPELSLVAELDGKVVGHVLISKAEVIEPVTDNRAEVLVLAPIGVHPDYQQQGVGGKLIQAGFEKSRALGYSHIFLIGHPSYYPRFGFRPAKPLGFELKQFPVPENVFMVYELQSEGSTQPIRGELRYPQAFMG